MCNCEKNNKRMIIEKILIIKRMFWNEKKIKEIIEYNIPSHGVNLLEKK